MFAHRPRIDAPDALGGQDGLFIRVLGPVDYAVGGEIAPLGSRMERKLLGAMALAANRAVSSCQLAEILWGDNPPASRDNTLQTYVSRLRQELGTMRITSVDNSYVLHVAEHELDALAFEVRVGDAAGSRTEPRQCLVACNEALALWRGVPFGTFSSDEPFRLEAMRLDGIRMFVVEMSLECEIALGNEDMVVGALEALVQEYPYRERLWHLLVAALALCGRRVEALRTCERLRAVLAETGLDPTAEFRRLESEILREEPGLPARMRSVIADYISN